MSPHKTRKPGHHFFRSFAVIFSVCALTAFLYVCGIFEFLENKAYDYCVTFFAGSEKPSDEIFVIVLDQASLDWGQREKSWAWPWPREAYANLTDFFNLGGAQTLTFDVMFIEPSVYGNRDDEIFAQACAEFGGVVQTVFFSSQYGNTFSWPSDVEKPPFAAEGFEPVFSDTQSLAETIPKGALFPLSPFFRSAAALGSITGIADPDGIIRRGKLFYEFDGMAVPSLSLAALTARSTQRNTLRYNPENKTAEFLGKTFSASADGTVLLRFRKNIDAYIPYSASEILQSRDALLRGEEPLLDPALFAGAHVFFCFYAPGLFDICSTPLSSSYPGAGVHITMLDNMLKNDFITPLSSAVVLCIILCAACFAALAERLSVAAAIASVPFGTFLLATAVLLSYRGGVRVPFVSPFFALVLSFTVLIIIRYNTENAQKRYIKGIFKQYLSPAVIEQLIAHPEQVKLGGQLREISIFFSDVQSFTSIAERLSPEALTELLNEYLSAMSDIILESGGTIDKYEGDAIIAFWNAPLSQADHPKKALEAALSCQAALAEMNTSLSKKAGSPLFMRIGLNTGSAVVGNMGSKSRFDYTMLGDSVNLAARLEGLNKLFGTYTMCSAATARAASDLGCSIVFRELGRVAVVGKTEAVTVFEPLDEEKYKRLQTVLPIFSAGLEHFYCGRFSEAQAAFHSIAESDKPAFMYVQKCEKLIAEPPADWNGVWTAQVK